MKKRNTSTKARTIFWCLAGILFISLMSYVRLWHGDNVKRVAKDMGMRILRNVEGYETNKKYLDLSADLAHNSALEKAVKAVSRPRADDATYVGDFDKNTYLAEFFENLINQARNDGREDLVKALMALRDQDQYGIPRPADR